VKNQKYGKNLRRAISNFTIYSFLANYVMNTKFTIRSLTAIILCIALCQFTFIGERVIHAVWNWYKFHERQVSATTTLNETVIIFTYSISILLIVLNCITNNSSTDKYTHRVNNYSSYLLIIGLSLLTILLISPFNIIT